MTGRHSIYIANGLHTPCLHADWRGYTNPHRSATYTFGKKMAGPKLLGWILVHRKIHYTLPYTSNIIKH